EEGQNQLVVVNPGPDGGTSKPFPFTANDAPLDLRPFPQLMTEGLSFTYSVAFFTDAGLEPPDHYRATIFWGDGSVSDGVVKLTDGTTCNVFGTHTYLEEGPYTATVFVRDDGGAFASTSEPIQVDDAPLTPIAKTATFIESQSASAVVASF